LAGGLGDTALIFSQLRDQAAHTLVCGLAGYAASAAFGPLGAIAGFIVQTYREEGQHGFAGVFRYRQGWLDLAVGTIAGCLGAALWSALH